MCTKWETSTGIFATQRAPTTSGTINIFKPNKAINEQIMARCDLVWVTLDYRANTPKYFKVFKTTPSDMATLEKEYNACKLKHVTMGKNAWKSLLSSFDIEITGSKVGFHCGQEPDGPLL